MISLHIITTRTLAVISLSTWLFSILNKIFIINFCNVLYRVEIGGWKCLYRIISEVETVICEMSQNCYVNGFYLLNKVEISKELSYCFLGLIVFFSVFAWTCARGQGSNIRDKLCCQAYILTRNPRASSVTGSIPA